MFSSSLTGLLPCQCNKGHINVDIQSTNRPLGHNKSLDSKVCFFSFRCGKHVAIKTYIFIKYFLCQIIAVLLNFLLEA